MTLRSFVLALVTVGGLLAVRIDRQASTENFDLLECLGFLVSAVALVVSCFWVSRATEPDADVVSDPLLRLRHRPSRMIAAASFFILAGNVAFFDVIWDGATLVSAPHYYLTDDADRAAAGFGHTADPWAGNMIEAPGIFITAASLRDGVVPLWNPGEGCGSPHLANGELATLSALQLPLHLRPSLENWDRFAVARLVLAGWLAAIAAMGLGVTLPSALIAGSVFGFGGALVQHSNLVHVNTAVWVPLIVLFVESLLFRRSMLRVVMLAVAFALALNGGNPQPVVMAGLVIAVRLFLAPLGGVSLMATGRTLVAVGVAGGLGAALTAISILPLAETLGRSVTRVFPRTDGTAQWWALTSWILPSNRESEFVATLDYRYFWWAIGAFGFGAAFVGLVDGIRRRRPIALWGVFFVVHVLLFCTRFVETVFTELLPVVRELNFSKYVSPLQFLLGVCAASAIDSVVRGERFVRVAFVVAAVGIVAFLSLDPTPLYSTRHVVHVAVVAVFSMMIAIMPARRGRILFCLLPAFVIGELMMTHPRFPDRTECAYDRPTSFVDYVNDAREREGQEWRLAGHSNTVPPLSTSALGWRDLRSVSPVTPRSYHDWLGPYVNNGTWPEYWLFSESRQLLFSPCLDLAGVRWILVPSRAPLLVGIDRVIEDSPVIRWGEMLRAMDFETIRIYGEFAMDDRQATFRLGPRAKLEFDAHWVSRQTRFEYELTSDGPFVATVRAGDDVHEIVASDVGRVTLELPYRDEPVRLIYEVKEGGPVRFQLTGLEIDRFFPKRLDQFRFAHADNESGVAVATNLEALAPVRMVRRTRAFETIDDLERHYLRFVATGEGWDWREELLIYAPEGTPRPDGVANVVDASSATEPEVRRVSRPDVNRIRVEVDARAPGWLHVAETHHGFWRATSAGRDLAVVRANGPFMAVPILEAGRHEIEFVYDPWPYRVGKWVSIVTAFVLLGMTMIAVVRRRRRST